MLRFGGKEMKVQVDRYKKLLIANPHENPAAVELAYAISDIRECLPCYMESFLNLCDRMHSVANEAATKEALAQPFFEPLLPLRDEHGNKIGRVPNPHQLWFCPVETAPQHEGAKIYTYQYNCPLCGAAVTMRSVNKLPKNPSAQQIAVVACPTVIKRRWTCAEALSCIVHG